MAISVRLIAKTTMVDRMNPLIEDDKMLAGLNAGICYMPDDFNTLEEQSDEVKIKRGNRTMNMGHHSVAGHISVNMVIEGIPKICAMLLNSLGEYNTSEKSARYTRMKNIPGEEEMMYDKWLSIYDKLIADKYPHIDVSDRIKLAMENARYVISIFTPTTISYTTSIRQINYIIDWCRDLKNRHNFDLMAKIVPYMEELADALHPFYIVRLRDDKCRGFDLITDDMTEWNETKISYGYRYTSKYTASFAALAQLQRHRTIDYKVFLLDKTKVVIPPILIDTEYVNEWVDDIHSLAHLYPQGIGIGIIENGSFENFILKAKERECSHAQLEIQEITTSIHTQYEDLCRNVKIQESLKKYNKKLRCGFEDYTCISPCKWGMDALNRKI